MKNVFRRIMHLLKTRKDCRRSCLTCDYFEVCADLFKGEGEAEDLKASAPASPPEPEEYLKPCPFCGSTEVKVIGSAQTHQSWIVPEARGHLRCVACGECGCNGGIYNVKALGESTAREKAIESWNTRVEDIIHSDGSFFAVSITDSDEDDEAAMRDIDAHEAEYGADGTRVFREVGSEEI